MPSDRDDAARFDDRLEKVVRQHAPEGFARLDAVIASACGRSQAWTRVEDAGGQPIPWDPPFEVVRTVSKTSADEYETDRGRWISVRIRLAGAEARIERDWDSRIYFGDHPGAPFDPPAAGEPDPTDEQWRHEFQKKWRRDDEHIPSWLPARAEPLNLIDDDRPLTGLAAALANDESTAPWISRVREALREHVESMAGMRDGLRDGAGNINRNLVTGIADVTIDQLEADLDSADGDDAKAGKRVIEQMDEVVTSILEAQYTGG